MLTPPSRSGTVSAVNLLPLPHVHFPLSSGMSIDWLVGSRARILGQLAVAEHDLRPRPEVRDCGICYRAGAQFQCERCRTWLHDYACYLRKAASTREVRWLQRADDDDCEELPAGRSGFLIICGRCRS